MRIASRDGLKYLTPQQCEKNQTEVTCGYALDRCFKADKKKKMENGSEIERELRGCADDKYCDLFKKQLEQAEMFGWDFDLACCMSELCNTGERVTFETALWMSFVLSSVLVMI